MMIHLDKMIGIREDLGSNSRHGIKESALASSAREAFSLKGKE